MSATVTCSLCAAVGDNPPVQGIAADMPEGWAAITVAERGRPVVNALACPSCTDAVRTAASAR
jgi:hypothetical protein